MNHYKQITLLLLATLLTVSCSSPIKDQYQAERMLYKAGKQYQQVMINPRIANQTDYFQAVAGYQDILDKYPEKTTNRTIESVKQRAYFMLAELWLLQGETSKAIEVYETFLQNYPDEENLTAFVHFLNARSNEQILNVDKAIDEYQEVFDKLGKIEDPLKPNLNIINLPLKVARLQRYARNQGNGADGYDNAIDYYNSIAQQHPNSPTAFAAQFYAASIHADNRNWPEAIRILRDLVRQYPDREEVPNIILSLGNVYLEALQDFNQAGALYDKLLEKYPDHDVAKLAHYGKARILIARGRNDEGRTQLKWIIETYPEFRNLCASAQLVLSASYERQGDWDRALVEYRWLQETYPASAQGLYVPVYIPETYRRRGNENLMRDAYGDALQHYGNIIKKYPRTVLAGSAQEYVIYCHAALKQWEEAASAASRLEQIYPGSKSRINRAVYLGQIYEQMEDLDKAIGTYETFLADFPNHPINTQLQTRIDLLKQQL